MTEKQSRLCGSSEEFFLTSTDFLALGICILAVVATQQGMFPADMYGALFRTILALLAIRCIAFRSPLEQNLIAGMAMGFMALVVLVTVF